MFNKFSEFCYINSVKLFSSTRTPTFVNRFYHSKHVFGYIEKIENTTTRFQVPNEVLQIRCKESNLFRLVTAYREHGHKYANIDPVSFSLVDPLTLRSVTNSELDYKRYGLHLNDIVQLNGILNTSNQPTMTVDNTISFLNNTYTKNIGAEFTYLESEEEREWFSNAFEKLAHIEVDDISKIQIATELLKSLAFDNFMAKKFSSVKRYGAEGAESMITFFSNLFQLAAYDNIKEIVLGMPHRGRLNLLTGLLKYPPVQMFSKLKGNPDYPKKYQFTGDVLSHIISSCDLEYDNKSVHVSLLYNPSHLEAINPVSMGKTRAKQLTHEDGDYSSNDASRWGDKVLNVQIHGDAAIIGQGINQECLELSAVPNYEIGGTIHMVVNNQVGFTTPGDRGRSSRYCTDVAKIIGAPVLHVNGDCPEDVLKATRLAFMYQRRFRKDVFIDLNCYRLWGHNEMDDPTFTNPALYKIVKSKLNVADLYVNQLIEAGLLTKDQRDKVYDDHNTWLTEELSKVDRHEPIDIYFRDNWSEMQQPEEAVSTWDSGIDMDLMTFIGQQSVTYPKDFIVHPTILRGHVKNRLNKIEEGMNLDWATAEALAFGSLLFEGYNVRLSGEDVGRGTFSHRHAMLVNQDTNDTYIPLNHMHPNQKGFLEVANSILSEEAVLGYEYGMSIESPKNFVVWEAQFGDFFNGAQIIFDTFISNGEAKWLWQSGLTILLPHGYDGAGPEHSSARIERFLQMTDSKMTKVDGDNVNMQVCQPSTPAQYFHLLRRQMVRNFRKPLIVVAPKTLLRSSACTSDFTDMNRGTYFKPVLGDSYVDPAKVEKVLFTSGKHYYTLFEKRGSLQTRDTAILRLESYCPFPTMELQEELSKFKKAKLFVWCQEEPENMGAWSFVQPRFENLLGRKINYCGRPPLPAPAVGVGRVHQQQVTDIVVKPFLFKV